ncbi:ABC transporter substrate-binding protein [Promicromonospora sp. NPDC060204]|uniref:ABC transporter substrate-binding protein n=1 Tax=Promicromonospora sp. NPDC060204 TaxID=3347071 RepID=UPI003668AB62
MRVTPNNHSTRRRGRGAAVAAGSLTIAASLLLAGCGSTDDPADDGEIELTFLNQSRGQEAALNQLAEQYTEETGIKITVDSPGPADYLPKLQARAQSRDMPDIYSSFNATEMAPFYKAGWAMDLTEDLEAGWKDSFSPAVVKMSTFEDGNNLGIPAGVYSVHWETQTYGFLINPALTGIDQAEPPQTTGELTAALAAADTGSGTFSVAASVTPLLVQGLASNWLTDEQIAATFDGEESWEQDGWRNAFQYLVDLKEAGVITNDALPGGQDDNPDVESAFFTQGTGAIFDASPGVSVGLATNPEFEDYFSIGLPAADDGTLDPRSPGIPGKGAVINPKGEHPDEALAFVKWLTEPEQQTVFAEVGRILPTNPELLAGGDVPQQLTGFADGVEGLQVMSTTFATDVKTAIVAESERLVLGETTIDEALAAIQAAQDRVS